jgi:hypothetical protein
MLDGDILDGKEKDQTTKEAIELLRSIKTLDDLKEHKDEIMTFVENTLKAGVEELKTFLESAMSMTPEEKEQGFAKFQDETFLFNEEMGLELERIDNLPGAIEYLDSFRGEMEERMEPHLEEFSKQMAESMSQFMGDLMGGLVEGFGEAMEGMDDSVVTDDSDTRPELEWLTFFHDIRTLEDLKKEKDYIIDTIDEIISEILEDFRNLQSLDLPFDVIKAEFERFQKKQDTIGDELEQEFERMSAFPDGGEFVKSVNRELKDRVRDKMEEIERLVGELKNKKE